MSESLQPGDRVLDLRAVSRSGGVFVGLVAAPLATALSGWWWVWCVTAALAGVITGLVLAGITARVVFPAPPGQAVVTRVGPAALGMALWASMSGGVFVAVTCAIAAFLGAGGVPAAVTLFVGLGISAGAGCLAALV